MSFNAFLDAAARRLDSLLCVGLDPHVADLPEPTAAAARAAALGDQAAVVLHRDGRVLQANRAALALLAAAWAVSRWPGWRAA